MQVATITQTGLQVEIVSVTGGWTTVRDTTGGDTRKVRNGALSDPTTITAPTTTRLVEERKNGVVFAGYLPQYEAYKTQTTEGTTKRSIDKGDAVALQLRPLALMSVYATVSNATGSPIADLLERFQHLNPGMQRMNLGNVLRRTLREAAAK
jgi:hypothetical protein